MNITRLSGLIDHRDWRIVGMLTEEAGEVQGAFNKWQSGHPTKPKTEKDVREEIIQLGACCYLAAAHFGIPPAEFERAMQQFIDEKTEWIIDNS